MVETPAQRDPVYQQLNGQLRKSLGRDYQRGDKFLSEREISQRFDVSRATANKALANLVSAGLLEFRRGIGTFVRRDIINDDVQSLVSFTEKAKAAGKKPSTKLLTFERVDAGSAASAVQTSLGVQPKSQLWSLRRLRLADGVPVILEHRYVVARHCPKLSKAQVAGSLYSAFTESIGLKIAGADEIIRAVALKASEAKPLNVPIRSPALELISVGFLDDDVPLWWERTLYRGDQYEFHSRLGPIQTSTPARGVLR